MTSTEGTSRLAGAPVAGGAGAAGAPVAAAPWSLLAVSAEGSENSLICRAGEQGGLLSRHACVGEHAWDAEHACVGRC